MPSTPWIDTRWITQSDWATSTATAGTATTGMRFATSYGASPPVVDNLKEDVYDCGYCSGKGRYETYDLVADHSSPGGLRHITTHKTCSKCNGSGVFPLSKLKP